MQISSSIVTAAKRNGSKNLAGSGTPGEPFSQVDAVVELLAESTSPAAQRGARQLLKDMSTEPWVVIRGMHQSADDAIRHVTMTIHGMRYHLRLDGNHCVFDITCRRNDETQRPAGQKPFVGPGA